MDSAIDEIDKNTNFAKLPITVVYNLMGFGT